MKVPLFYGAILVCKIISGSLTYWQQKAIHEKRQQTTTTSGAISMRQMKDVNTRINLV